MPSVPVPSVKQLLLRRAWPVRVAMPVAAIAVAVVVVKRVLQPQRQPQPL